MSHLIMYTILLSLIFVAHSPVAATTNNEQNKETTLVQYQAQMMQPWILNSIKNRLNEQDRIALTTRIEPTSTSLYRIDKKRLQQFIRYELFQVQGPSIQLNYSKGNITVINRLLPPRF